MRILVKICVLFSLCFLPRVWTIHPSKFHDYMGNHDRQKLMKLADELLTQMRLRQQQLYAIKNGHNSRTPYQVGIVIGKLRERYKRMMEVYVEITDRRIGRTQLFGPGVWSNKPLHYFLAMEVIKHIEMEIKKQVHVLEVIPDSAFISEKELMAQQAKDAAAPSPADALAAAQAAAKAAGGRQGPGRQGPKRKPAQPSTDKPTTASVINYASKGQTFKNEAELKRSYREQYANRSGHVKGDQRSLDHYYGFV